MKWLRMISGGRKKPPKRPVKTQAHSRPVQPVRKPVKIDPAFEDTGSLELSKETGAGGNPYDTQTWEMDSHSGLRRVDNLRAKRGKPTTSETTDTYDTVIFRLDELQKGRKNA